MTRGNKRNLRYAATMLHESTPHARTCILESSSLEALLSTLLITARRLAPEGPEDLLHNGLLRLIEADSRGKLPRFASDSAPRRSPKSGQ